MKVLDALPEKRRKILTHLSLIDLDECQRKSNGGCNLQDCYKHQ
jgi:hypothetical protein